MPASRRLLQKLFLFPPVIMLLLVSEPAVAQMDMLPQIFRDLPPELQQGLPEDLSYREYRQLNRNIDFFSMFMSAIIPGYALFQVERPAAAWAVVGARAVGYAMMATSVARQWSYWSDLSRFQILPDRDYDRHVGDFLLFTGGIALNLAGWAADVGAAYHIAKTERDYVTYKYGLKSGFDGSTEQRHIQFIRSMILQDLGDSPTAQQDLRRSLREYAARYPDGQFRAEVEYYRGTLAYADADYATALLHFLRQLILHPHGRFSVASQREAVAVVYRNRAEWDADHALLLAALNNNQHPFPDIAGTGRHADADSADAAENVSSYLTFLGELQDPDLQRLFAAEAREIARRYDDEPYAALALRTAGDLLTALEAFSDAVLTYTQLAALYPADADWPYAVLQAGVLLDDRLDQPEYATRFYQRLLQTAPDSTEAAEARERLRMIAEQNAGG